VIKDSPADKAGLKNADVIVSYDGKKVNAETDLPKLVAATPIDTQVKLVIYREGKRKELFITVTRTKDSLPGAGSAVKPGEHASIGISVQELTPELAQRLGLNDGRGVVVSEIKPGSPAEEAGLVRGDLVLEVNGKRIDSIANFADTVSLVKKGEMVRLLLRRPDGSFGYVAIKAE
jgi:serine protease Do